MEFLGHDIPERDSLHAIIQLKTHCTSMLL